VAGRTVTATGNCRVGAGQVEPGVAAKERICALPPIGRANLPVCLPGLRMNLMGAIWIGRGEKGGPAGPPYRGQCADGLVAKGRLAVRATRGVVGGVRCARVFREARNTAPGAGALPGIRIGIRLDSLLTGWIRHDGA